MSAARPRMRTTSTRSVRRELSPVTGIGCPVRDAARGPAALQGRCAPFPVAALGSAPPACVRRSGHDTPSLAQRAIRRSYSSEEPGALAAHAGICAGGGPSLTVKGRPYRDQAADPCRVPRPRGREDPLPKPPYALLAGTPINGVPIQDRVLWSVRHSNGRGVQLVLRFRGFGHLPFHRLT